MQLAIQIALFFNQYVRLFFNGFKSRFPKLTSSLPAIKQVNPIALDALAWKYYIVYDIVLVIAIICSKPSLDSIKPSNTF